MQGHRSCPPVPLSPCPTQTKERRITMTKKLAIIHTTPATIASLGEMVSAAVPGIDIINFLDDSILPRLRTNGGNIEEVKDRVVQYGKFAEQSGADLILSACSSIGELAEAIQAEVSVPVVRIDEAMAEEAVRRGKRIGVVATISTTLNPTISLLKKKAKELGKDIELIPLLAEEAYLELHRGNAHEHDRILAEQLMNLEKQVDIIVLAQASMSRAKQSLPDTVDKNKILTSPPHAIKKIKQTLHRDTGTGSPSQP